MQGLHLTMDLYDCDCPPGRMTQEATLAQLCRERTTAAGLTVVAEKWHTFPSWQGQPGGVTGMLLLAESHLAVHTWPERRAVTLDVYVCNFTEDNTGKAQALIAQLKDAFQPQRALQQSLQRGEEPPPASQAAEGELVLESLDAHTTHGFRFAKRLLSRRTPFQQLDLLHSEQLGRTLMLDGAFMTSEADEFFYHEALVHPAALAHAAPRRALILGGGDGGAAEELLKHPTIEQVTLVDLDADVVAVAREHLVSIHRGALDDPRVQVRCEDGVAFVRTTPERYDLVLLDLTDPETPAGPLYTPAFLRELRGVLAPGGAVVLHLGAPFHEPGQVRALAQSLQEAFDKVSPYGLHVPLYGAYWGFAVASDRLAPARVGAGEIQERLAGRGIGRLRYYNAGVHGALFALPTFYQELVEGPARVPA